MHNASATKVPSVINNIASGVRVTNCCDRKVAPKPRASSIAGSLGGSVSGLANGSCSDDEAAFSERNKVVGR